MRAEPAGNRGARRRGHLHRRRWCSRKPILDNGSLTNTATADSDQTAPSTDSVTVSLAAPDLALAKTVTPSTFEQSGTILSYSYLVTNTGNVTLTDPVTVADDRATVTCPTTLLAPGQSLTCTATYTATQADVDAGGVINTATATSGPLVSPPDSATSLAARRPQLELTKSAAPTTYDHVGQVITYTYRVTNTSNVTLSGPVTVTDDKTTVICPATATLAPGASITCSATTTITQADLDRGAVVNHATAIATFGGDPVESDEAVAFVTAVKRPELLLDKAVTPATYAQPGDILTYSYVVTNTGNVTMTDPVTIDDDRTTVTCPTDLLAPGQTGHVCGDLHDLARPTSTPERSSTQRRHRRARRRRSPTRPPHSPSRARSSTS